MFLVKITVCKQPNFVLGQMLYGKMLHGQMLHGQMLHGQMLHGQMMHGQMLIGQMVLGQLSTVKDGSTNLKCPPLISKLSVN